MFTVIKFGVHTISILEDIGNLSFWNFEKDKFIFPFSPSDLKFCVDTCFNIRNNILKFQNDTITGTGTWNPGGGGHP